MDNEKIINFLTALVAAAVVLVMLATLAAPAILATVYGAKWLLLYPVMLAGILLVLPRKKWAQKVSRGRKIALQSPAFLYGKWQIYYTGG